MMTAITIKCYCATQVEFSIRAAQKKRNPPEICKLSEFKILSVLI